MAVINDVVLAQSLNTPSAFAAQNVPIIVDGATTITSALAVVKAVQIAPVNIGDPVQYAVVIQNTGAATATGVIIADNVPYHILFTNASTTKGSIVNLTNFNISVIIGDMAPGEIQTITITGVYAY